MRNHCRQRGFSLLEISIVLIIIALLAGGIMTGRSLIESSKLKDVMVDMDYYLTATKSFQSKYNALPGDIGNAMAIWGTLNATPATCYTTVATGTATCNGDNDTRIQTWNEQFRFWQHLKNAELIKGNYTGTGDPAGGQNPSRANIPETAVEAAFFAVAFLDTNPGGNFFDGNYGNHFTIGAISGANDDFPIFSAEQAQEIDNKVDDGKPGSGVIRSHRNGSSSNPNCATTTSVSTAAYNLADTTARLCSLMYVPGF
jgi:prepilin-type N-terminal cleavage/methylation domain-containing protein